MEAEGLRDGRTGDVGVHDGGLLAVFGSGAGQKRSDEGLADAALTGRNGDDLVHFAEGVGLPCEFFFVERYVFRHNRYLLLLICLS